jgi:hypothetical protein
MLQSIPEKQDIQKIMEKGDIHLTKTKFICITPVKA